MNIIEYIKSKFNMAAPDETTLEDLRFKAVTFYINWTTLVILAITIAVFFIPIPTSNEKFVDIGLGILLGILGSNAGTITGTQSQKKADTVATGDNTTVNNQPPTT